MPNTREKLIELLKGAGVSDFSFNAALADYLIANGVTFATGNNVGDKLTPSAEWISVKDRLPEPPKGD